MERFESNEALGYRTAGSLAERRTGGFICREMRRVGLRVQRDSFTLDEWEFLTCRAGSKPARGRAPLFAGGCQAQMVTGGPKEYGIHALLEGRAGPPQTAGRLAGLARRQRARFWEELKGRHAPLPWCKGAWKP